MGIKREMFKMTLVRLKNMVIIKQTHIKHFKRLKDQNLPAKLPKTAPTMVLTGVTLSVKKNSQKNEEHIFLLITIKENKVSCWKNLTQPSKY